MSAQEELIHRILEADAEELKRIIEAIRTVNSSEWQEQQQPYHQALT